jgi:hypothetical protein
MAANRSSPRHKRRLRVSVGSTPLFTSDVSAGGFSAEILRTPAPGTAVAGTLRLADAEVPYAGQVVWTRAGSPRLNLRGRIGVRFTSLPTAAARLLAAPSLPSIA